MMAATGIAFLYTIFSVVIFIAFQADAKAERSKVHMKVYFFAGLSIFIGAVLTVVFLLAAVVG